MKHFNRIARIAAAAALLSAAPAFAKAPASQLDTMTNGHIKGYIPVKIVADPGGTASIGDANLSGMVILPTDDPANMTGTVDKGNCVHPTAEIHADAGDPADAWTITYPSYDNCNDYVNVPPWIMHLKVEAIDDNAAHGIWMGEANCFVHTTSGTWDLNLAGKDAQGRPMAYLNMVGIHNLVTWAGCPGPLIRQRAK